MVWVVAWDLSAEAWTTLIVFMGHGYAYFSPIITNHLDLARSTTTASQRSRGDHDGGEGDGGEGLGGGGKGDGGSRTSRCS